MGKSYKDRDETMGLHGKDERREARFKARETMEMTNPTLVKAVFGGDRDRNPRDGFGMQRSRFNFAANRSMDISHD